MVRVVIVDDEENSRDSLKGKLGLFCPDVEIVGEVGTVADGVSVITEQKPDALFLDIKLAGESGFDILESIRDNEELDPEIIFITAHDEFAIKAIKFSALDYLLKPIDPEDLVRSIRKVEEGRGTPKETNNIDVLVENIRQASEMPKKIVVPTSDGMHVIKLSEIVRLESSSNYTTFTLTSGKTLLASRTLKEFDGMLTNYNFMRIHKSHLINMNCLKRYVQTDGGYIILEDGSKIPVANRKKELLLSTLKNL